MACGIVDDWGKIGKTVIKICNLKTLSGYEGLVKKIEKI